MTNIDPGLLGGYTTPPAASGRGGNPFASAPAAGPGVGSGTAAQNDSFATLRSILEQYGLGSLAQWAWDQLVNNRSPNEIMLDLVNQPAFKQRFPAIDQRRQAGLPSISPAEYINYETQARQLMRAAGFPQGFYDQPDDFTNYIAGDVSLAELSQRVQIYQQAAYQAPAEVRQQLKDLYGVDEGGIAAFFADEKRALPALQQQYTSAQIAGQAQRQRFGPLSVTEAERLAQLGVTADAAAQGFGMVDQARELFRALPGEADQAPGRADALGLVSGDSGAQQAVDLQARRRKAQFGGGGTYATGQQGVSGLGSAAS